MKTIAQQLNWDFATNGELEIKDKNGNRIYDENSDGFWTKRKYDSKGEEIYYENSDGFWAKCEYDSQGNVIYYENSRGKIIDKRPKPCENKVVEIEGVKYKLIKL
jgi:hypothetical protein